MLSPIIFCLENSVDPDQLPDNYFPLYLSKHANNLSP